MLFYFSDIKQQTDNVQSTVVEYRTYQIGDTINTAIQAEGAESIAFHTAL